LHHYVLRSRRPSIAELIANGGLHAGFVLADREAPWNSLAGLPELSLWIDGRRQGTATGADLARTAVHSVRWLAEQGLALTEGMVILTGSLLNLYTVQPGAAIVADLATVGRSTARA
jgi:2-keto-4-pentenoate hydratase